METLVELSRALVRVHWGMVLVALALIALMAGVVAEAVWQAWRRPGPSSIGWNDHPGGGGE